VEIPAWMEGKSLAPLMNGEKSKSRPVFSMQLEANRQGQQISKGTIAVWEGEFKLISYLNEEKSLLYNLGKDPDELNNIFDGYSSICFAKRIPLFIIKSKKKAVLRNFKNGFFLKH